MPTVIALLMMSVVGAEDGGVSFIRDVAPIFLENCVACHDAKKAEGGYRIDTFTESSKPGDSGLMPLKASKDDGAELLRLLVQSSQGRLQNELKYFHFLSLL